MKGMLAAVLAITALSLAPAYAADGGMDDGRTPTTVAKAATTTKSTATDTSSIIRPAEPLPPGMQAAPGVSTTEADAIESAIAGAFSASDQPPHECSDALSAYCTAADKAAGALMLRAREKYEKTEFSRDH